MELDANRGSFEKERFYPVKGMDLMTTKETAFNDERYKTIDRTMKRFDYKKDALLEVLNSAQDAFGFLSRELLQYISRQLNIPLSRVYGVATFYHMFTFEPLGEHHAIVCAGTACYVKGSNKIQQALTDEYKVNAGETTADGSFGLKVARCLGSCGLAPVVVLDGEVRARNTPEEVLASVKEMISAAKEVVPQV
jgi:bidirectional [NiFe] hydrogenase diaphorase subunit